MAAAIVRHGLTLKQEAFCRAYLNCENLTEAYKQSYRAENMKDTTIHVSASRLMDEPMVALRIHNLQTARAMRAEVTVDRVVQEFSRLAFLDIRKAFDSEGNLLPMSDMPDDVAAAITGVEFEEIFEMQGSGKERQRVHTGRIHKIKVSDKWKALDSLAKYLSVYAPEKLEVRHSQALDYSKFTTEELEIAESLRRSIEARSSQQVPSGKVIDAVPQQLEGEEVQDGQSDTGD